MKNEIGLATLSIILWLYFIASQICMIYFWHEWCQDHGFLNSLIIGPIVSEIKGLLFPFFMQLMEDYSKDDVVKALNSIEKTSRKRVLVDQRSYLIGILYEKFKVTEKGIADLIGVKRTKVNYARRLPIQFKDDKLYKQNVYVYAQMFPYDFSESHAVKSGRHLTVAVTLDSKLEKKLNKIRKLLGHDHMRTTIKYLVDKSIKLWEE